MVGVARPHPNHNRARGKGSNAAHPGPVDLEVLNVHSHPRADWHVNGEAAEPGVADGATMPADRAVDCIRCVVRVAG